MFELSEKGFNGDKKAILEVSSLRKHLVKLLDKVKT